MSSLPPYPAGFITLCSLQVTHLHSSHPSSALVLTCHRPFGRSDAGKVYACGKNDYGQLGTGVMWEAHELKPMALNIASRSIKVACGYSHTLILSTDGEVCACGRKELSFLLADSLTHDLPLKGMTMGNLD